MKMNIIHAILWCYCLYSTSDAIPRTLLYDYKGGDVSQLPRGDDVSSSPFQLSVPVVLYGISFDSVYVNTNGLLSFQAEFSTFLNTEFPLPDPIVAPLYSNVDTRAAGNIYYYETSDPALLQRSVETIQESFSEAAGFQPATLFVATWEDVGYHEGGSDKLNTFQVIISTDGEDTYIEFIYPEDGIQWIQGTGDKEYGLPDARAQAGFISADGRYYILPGSGTDQIRHLDKRSNINVPGQWLFRIGQVDQNLNIEEPDLHAADIQEGPTTCAKAATYCHSQAACKEFEQGVCCKCKDYYYGNGRHCIKKDVPLRVNGKVNGVVNGVKIDNLDLQSYVVLDNGKAYTAVSNVPEGIGNDVQSLEILGATIGWLFALPVNEAQNGYQLTGGLFNHSATITFTNTSQKLTIRQKYLGLDVFDQLRMECDIQGETPHLPVNAKIKISDYQEQHTLTAPGIIQSSSVHKYSYEDFSGSEATQVYTIDQNFIFDYCKYEALPVGVTWRLRVGRYFIAFDNREKIIRFGMSNKIGPLGDVDPCQEGRATCGPNSACVVENDSFKCVCNPGYQQIYTESGETCVDINECQAGLHVCDINAECINEVGTYSCQCNPGYDGDGWSCKSTASCRNVQCGENAVCVEEGTASCKCIEGFTGDGQRCSPLVAQSCHIANNCSPYGLCTISQETQQYYCVCLPGYEGDGYNCNLELQPTTEADGRIFQICHQGVCWCPSGYAVERDSNYCAPVEVITESASETTTTEVAEALPEVQCYNSSLCFCPRGFTYNSNYNSCLYNAQYHSDTKGFSGYHTSCAVLNNCNHNAQCLYSSFTNDYQCVCNDGFEGNGYTCQPARQSCSVADVCDIHASCVYSDSYETYVCECNPGYEGDGYQCKISTICASSDDCPENEECLYVSVSQQYECVCKEGLSRDSQHHCVQLAGSCGGGTCVENAECLYDDQYQTYYCSCKSGYQGDGISECIPKPAGCNVLNNCGLHANCQYNSDQNLYLCKCDEGYYGDGFVCDKEKDCNNDPRLCDRRASCIADAARRFKCQCNFGYTGNGTICKENPRYDGNFLVLNQGMATFKIPLEASETNRGKLLHLKAQQMAIGLDVDCLQGKIYWSDINGKAIRRLNYNGTDEENFITNDIGSPEGLAIDWVSRNIYWTDSTKDTVEVANLETKLRRTLFDTQLVNPRGIAVHPQRGKIFWSDWNRKSPKIEWANADGTDRQTFLQGKNVQLPNSLAIDFETEQLCYADAGTKSIECVDIDTKIQRTVAVNCTYPFGIAVTSNQVYWSDWISKKIERADKRTLTRLPALPIPLSLNINRMYSLVAVPQNCPGLVNVCQFYQDQCPSGHICLPNGKGSRSCACGYKSDAPLEKPLCNY